MDYIQLHIKHKINQHSVLDIYYTAIFKAKTNLDVLDEYQCKLCNVHHIVYQLHNTEPVKITQQ